MRRNIPGLTVCATPADVARAAAELITTRSTEAAASTGRFTLSLAGGTTPRPVYELLATPPFSERIPWARVHVFFGDERCVPPTDEQSNYFMAKRAMLEHIPLPPSQVHRIRGESDPTEASLAYERELRSFFGPASPPALDLVVLGLGRDGHTASLFPDTDSLHERERWVVPQYVADLGVWRVTTTYTLINTAREVVFVVTGADKADVLARVLSGPHVPEILPAQGIHPASGSVRWLVDAAAGARLGPGSAEHV